MGLPFAGFTLSGSTLLIELYKLLYELKLSMGVRSKIYTGGHREVFADLNKQTKLDSLELN